MVSQEEKVGTYALLVRVEGERKLKLTSKGNFSLYRRVEGEGPAHIWVSDLNGEVKIPVAIALEDGWRIAEKGEDDVPRAYMTVTFNAAVQSDCGPTEQDV